MFRNDVFTTKQLTEILRIHPPTFAGWLKKKILWPRIYEARGKGTAHLFSLHNIFEATIIRELARDQYPLKFINAVLGCIEERQLIQTFLDRVSKGEETELQVYLLWAGDFVGQPSFMEVREAAKPQTELKFDFERRERTLVLNLTRLFKRISIEIEELGVEV